MRPCAISIIVHVLGLTQLLFPLCLVPVEEEQPFSYELVLAIVVPILVLIVALTAVWLLFRYLKRKAEEKKENSSVREEFLPEKYGIRAQQVGDSTLQVKKIGRMCAFSFSLHLSKKKHCLFDDLHF